LGAGGGEASDLLQGAAEGALEVPVMMRGLSAMLD